MDELTCIFSRLFGALTFAAHKHRDQRRKDAGATPYINHPIAVAHILAGVGVRDLVTLQAAVLHDTMEDTVTTSEELRSAFGPEVAACVQELTDDKSKPKDERKRLQLANAAHKSARAAQIKLADKICNLRDLAGSPPVGWSEDRKREYYDWAKRVVDALPGEHAELRTLFDEAYAARP